jgi:hypothetical protein
LLIDIFLFDRLTISEAAATLPSAQIKTPPAGGIFASFLARLFYIQYQFIVLHLAG